MFQEKRMPVLDDARQQDETQDDAVGGEMKVDAERRDPCVVGDGDELAGAICSEGCRCDSEAGECGDKREGSCEGGVTLRQEELEDRS